MTKEEFDNTSFAFNDVVIFYGKPYLIYAIYFDDRSFEFVPMIGDHSQVIWAKCENIERVEKTEYSLGEWKPETEFIGRSPVFSLSDTLVSKEP